MRRVDSKLVPYETHQMLRKRLVRFLPAAISNPVDHDLRSIPPFSDREVLDLFRNILVAPGNDVDRLEAIYTHERSVEHRSSAEQELKVASSDHTLKTEEASVRSTEGVCASAPGNLRGGDGSDVTTDSKSEGTPTQDGVQIQFTVQAHHTPPALGDTRSLSFAELIGKGWIRRLRNRILVPDEILFSVLRNREITPTAFGALIDERYKNSFSFPDSFLVPESLKGIVAGLIDGSSPNPQIQCVSRPWIAARLWDSELKSANNQKEDDIRRLEGWIEKWRLLGHPIFALSIYLENDAYEKFVDVAMHLLEGPGVTPDWLEFRKASVTPTTLLYPHRISDIDSIVPEIPNALIEKAHWAMGHLTEKTYYDYAMNTTGASVTAVLLNQIQFSDADPAGVAKRLLNLALNKPVLLSQLVQRANAAPSLLADMLMFAPTCALACSLIADWRFNHGGWNREFQAPADRTLELLAFEDALALLGEHIDSEQIPVDELASLYLHLYRITRAKRMPANRNEMLSLLRDEISNASPVLHDAVVRDVLESGRTSDDPMCAFCAALDLASEGNSLSRLQPEPFVSFYLDTLLPAANPYQLKELGFRIAQGFISLAQRCEEGAYRRVLNAIDVPTWLQAESESLSENVGARRLMIHRIRLHVRLLSRAISEWPTAIPDELVSALGETIRAGATNNPGRGRLDAFAPLPGEEESYGSSDLPIAVDIAAALRSLEGQQLRIVTTRICEIEEPTVLAGIVANTSDIYNAQIRAHLLTLTPANSSDVYTLPALQSRIEALLNAKLPDAAKVFLDAERAAKTWGLIPEREVNALRADLRLLLLRKDWDSISSFTVPENISCALKQNANDVILFYKGVAELQKPQGNPAFAEQLFEDLVRRQKQNTSYVTNLFASRLQRLLHDNGLKILTGDSLSEAKRYIVEAKQAIRPMLVHTPTELSSFNSNLAVLLLAAGQAKESNQLLMELREQVYDSRTEGFRAVALARLGSRRESLALLTQVERTFGRSEFLSAIRENIDTHTPFATAPSLSLNDDPVPGIRQAFDAFTRLGHAEQAEVLQSRGRLDLYLQEEIRGACAGLVAIAPMMRGLEMVRNEDDISAVLKQILRARFLLQQWAVEDQSKGGFSRTGGPGERDILISKGAAVLAVLEALIVDSVEATNLTSHFNKLLGYDTCRFFFHITYARGANCSRILAHLKNACRTPPAGIAYVSAEDLEDFDSMPIGFRAHLQVDSRPITVSFLALEIGQPTQRAAAAAQ